MGREARHASFARTAIDSRRWSSGEKADGRIENEMWAESMVEKWPIFQIVEGGREGGGSFMEAKKFLLKREKENA